MVLFDLCCCRTEHGFGIFAPTEISRGAVPVVAVRGQHSDCRAGAGVRTQQCLIWKHARLIPCFLSSGESWWVAERPPTPSCSDQYLIHISIIQLCIIIRPYFIQHNSPCVGVQVNTCMCSVCVFVCVCVCGSVLVNVYSSLC